MCLNTERRTCVECVRSRAQRAGTAGLRRFGRVRLRSGVFARSLGCARVGCTPSHRYISLHSLPTPTHHPDRINLAYLLTSQVRTYVASPPVRTPRFDGKVYEQRIAIKDDYLLQREGS
ncbi:unnamed protein product [Arctia plantaginis]|uniref:Uncharacterized protein n=1 Tax=Arctia plantaginis TaxID=874455 RepID=A0A8S0ZEZ9_ARCPL|nr:unnamed protein product [Arctia plantaginis]